MPAGKPMQAEMEGVTDGWDTDMEGLEMKLSAMSHALQADQLQHSMYLWVAPDSF